MKNFLLTVIMIPFFSYAQDCSKYLTKETDRFTSITRIKTIDITKKNKSGAVEFIMNMSKKAGDPMRTLVLYINNPNFGCVDQGEKISFLFSDSTNETISYYGSLNCKGYVIVLLNTYSEYNSLEKSLTIKTISAIRVGSSSSSYEIDVKHADAEKFMKSAKCFYLSN